MVYIDGGLRMKLKCYICEAEVKAGEGERVEGKLVHIKCRDEYYAWKKEIYKSY